MDSYKILAVKASRTRSSMDANTILRKVLKAYTNKPLPLVDRAPWYRWALERLLSKMGAHNLQQKKQKREVFRTLKQRTKRFYNNINQRRRGIQEITQYHQPYTLHYNELRYHQSIRRCPSNVTLG